MISLQQAEKLRNQTFKIYAHEKKQNNKIHTKLKNNSMTSSNIAMKEQFELKQEQKKGKTTPNHINRKSK